MCPTPTHDYSATVAPLPAHLSPPACPGTNLAPGTAVVNPHVFLLHTQSGLRTTGLDTMEEEQTTRQPERGASVGFCAPSLIDAARSQNYAELHLIPSPFSAPLWPRP